MFVLVQVPRGPRRKASRPVNISLHRIVQHVQAFVCCTQDAASAWTFKVAGVEAAVFFNGVLFIMSDINLKHPHGMSFDDAKVKVNEIVTGVQSEFPQLIQSIDWNTDKTSAKVKGKGFGGTFGVDEEHVAIDIDLGFAAKMFKGKIESKIKDQVSKYFG